MTPPKQRNIKKYRRKASKPSRGAYKRILPLVGSGDGRAEGLSLEEELEGLSFEERLDAMSYPGRWLEEQPQGDILGERLLGGRGRFLQDASDAEDEVDPDIGHDYDDFV